MSKIEKYATVTVPCRVRCLLSYDEDEGVLSCVRLLQVDTPTLTDVDRTLVEDDDAYEYYVAMFTGEEE